VCLCFLKILEAYSDKRSANVKCHIYWLSFFVSNVLHHIIRTSHLATKIERQIKIVLYFARMSNAKLDGFFYILREYPTSTSNGCLCWANIILSNKIKISERIYDVKFYYLSNTCEYQMLDFIDFQRSSYVRGYVFFTNLHRQSFLNQLIYILANIEHQIWCTLSEYQTKLCFYIFLPKGNVKLNNGFKLSEYRT